MPPCREPTPSGSPIALSRSRTLLTGPPGIFRASSSLRLQSLPSISRSRSLMSDIERVKTLFSDAGVMLSRDDVWAVQGTPVVKHKALERLAAALKIRFEKPDIL